MVDVLRRMRFAPYRAGCGPRFALTTWDTGRARDCKWMIGYRLTMITGRRREVLFEGEDFGCSPMNSIDSDAACAGIMSFLTLKPGDTDPEYFASYTPAQMEYCRQHAEALSGAVHWRFGD